MQDKEFIIFYYDVDSKGNTPISVEKMTSCFKILQEAMGATHKVILLPNCFRHSEWLSREKYIELLQKEIDNLKREEKIINTLSSIGNVNPLFPEELEKAMIKDCTNCLHGNYNDYHNQYFCYNPTPCHALELWEPKE